MPHEIQSILKSRRVVSKFRSAFMRVGAICSNSEEVLRR
jgi:hypothetical protein